MATATFTAAPAATAFHEPRPAPIIPPLQAGDRLTRAEFERRYHAMPNVKKVELIEGVVYMPSPVSNEGHAVPHTHFNGILFLYCSQTPSVQAGDNATIRLDLDNEPQPDVYLRILPSHGGQSRNDNQYIGGAPELIAEIAASSVNYDLHDKLRAYRRNGVREYVVWRVSDRVIDWFVLREGIYEPLSPAADGLLHSEVFPGLWLDAAALLDGNLAKAIEAVQRGLASPEHAEFVTRLQQAAGPR